MLLRLSCDTYVKWSDLARESITVTQVIFKLSGTVSYYGCQVLHSVSYFDLFSCFYFGSKYNTGYTRMARKENPCFYSVISATPVSTRQSSCAEMALVVLSIIFLWFYLFLFIFGRSCWKELQLKPWSASSIFICSILNWDHVCFSCGQCSIKLAGGT